jgi:hypothetical protein
MNLEVPKMIKVDKKSIAESTVDAMRDIEWEMKTTPILAMRRTTLTIKLRLIANLTEEANCSSFAEVFVYKLSEFLARILGKREKKRERE